MSANKMLLVVVLLRTYFPLFLLVALVVLDRAFADVELACPRLAVPLGTRTSFYCSSNGSSGLDISLAGSPDVPIYGSAQEGYTVTRGLLTVSVVEKTSTILRVAISFNVSLPLLNTYLSCTSVTNGKYGTCLVSYPRPRLDPHAAVLCEERNEDGCSLTSLSWNCSKNQLPLKEVKVLLDGDEKANVSQGACIHYFRDDRTRSSSNLTLVGHYVTGYSSTETALINLHSPFQISRNSSEDDGSNTFMFDVVQDQKTVILLSLVRSDNLTIEKEATAPLFVRIPRNFSISYTIGTLLVIDKIAVFYEEHGTYDQPCLECNHHENGTNTSESSTIQHRLIIIILSLCLAVYCT